MVGSSNAGIRTDTSTASTVSTMADVKNSSGHGAEKKKKNFVKRISNRLLGRKKSALKQGGGASTSSPNEVVAEKWAKSVVKTTTKEQVSKSPEQALPRTSAPPPNNVPAPLGQVAQNSSEQKVDTSVSTQATAKEDGMGVKTEMDLPLQSEAVGPSQQLETVNKEPLKESTSVSLKEVVVEFKDHDDVHEEKSEKDPLLGDELPKDIKMLGRDSDEHDAHADAAALLLLIAFVILLNVPLK